MRITEINEICEWCAEYGLVVEDSFKVNFPSYSHSAKFFYEVDGKPKHSSEAATACLKSFGAWDETLVWITQWGIWPSSEDWPDFYNWRGSQGEKRELHKAPGHFFNFDEAEMLFELVERIINFGWDAQLLVRTNQMIAQKGAFISHDGFITLSSASQISVVLPET